MKNNIQERMEELINCMKAFLEDGVLSQCRDYSIGPQIEACIKRMADIISYRDHIQLEAGRGDDIFRKRNSENFSIGYKASFIKHHTKYQGNFNVGYTLCEGIIVDISYGEITFYQEDGSVYKIEKHDAFLKKNDAIDAIICLMEKSREIDSSDARASGLSYQKMHENSL